MVDTTGGIAGIQNLQSAGRTQTSKTDEKREGEKAEREERLNPQDKVSISQEALNLSEAKKASEEVKVALEVDQNATLGLDPAFDEAI